MIKKLKLWYYNWMYRKNVRQMYKTMKAIDYAFSKSNIPRSERRRMWSDFKKSNDHAEFLGNKII